MVTKECKPLAVVTINTYSTVQQQVHLTAKTGVACCSLMCQLVYVARCGSLWDATVRCSMLNRSTYLHYALCRASASAYVSIVHAGWPCGAGVRKLVRAQGLWLNRTWKASIIYTWLVKTLHIALSSFAFSLVLFLQPQALLASIVHWLASLLSLSQCLSQCRLRSALDSAKHVPCGGPAALSSLPFIVKKPCPHH